MAKFEVSVVDKRTGISQKSGRPFYMVLVKDSQSDCAYSLFTQEDVFKSCDVGSKHILEVKADWNGRGQLYLH